MSRSFLLLVATIFSVSCNLAQAGILVGDWKTSGDGLLTIDTTQGLEFLDVTQSRSRSVEEVMGNFGVGGVYEGFRYATEQEAVNLINEIGWSGTPAFAAGIESLQASYNSNTEAKAILDLLGHTFDSGAVRSTAFFTGTLVGTQYRQIKIGDTNKRRGVDRADATITGKFTSKHREIGSLLVRASSSSSSSSGGGVLPEPSSLTMFGFAGLGLLIARRRR